MKNLELKVRAGDLAQMARRAVAIGAVDHGILRDTDTYFQAAHGRLKLRQTAGQPTATLIAYQRPDQPGSRYSDYSLVPVANPDELSAALSAALGILAVVVKERHLCIYGATRIHLDHVEGLGTFVELETVLSDQGVAAGEAEHSFVRDSLGLAEIATVAGSYLDLHLVRESQLQQAPSD